MKTSLLIILAAAMLSGAPADTPASPPAAASSENAQSSPHPTVLALSELTDAECVALESYLLRASRAALLAYANAFEDAYRKRDGRALQMLVYGHSPVMPSAMCEAPMEDIPTDFQNYLKEFYGALSSEITRKSTRNAARQPRRETLREKYPRAACCLPPSGLFLQLDEARSDVEGAFWAQRISPEEYVAAYRRLADELAQSMDAARSRHALTRVSLKPYDTVHASAVGFFIGGEQEFRFLADARMEYRWQLAEPLPADSPISLEWSEKAEVLYPHIPDEAAKPLEPGRRVRIATIRGVSAGEVTLRFAFTRPGDMEPLFTREVEVSIMEPVPEEKN